MKLVIKKISYFIILSVLVFIISCKKDDVISGSGSLTVEFDNVANGSSLVLGDNYINDQGETMKFSAFNYYVSNFSLVKTDGTVYTIPKDECYFLIKEDGGENSEIELKNIPAGDYKEVRFMIGVDSLKSISPTSERIGVLDPAGEGAGMYWAWNSGYIFVKAEGTSPQAPFDNTTNSNRFRYHIGLFGGYSSPTLNNIKTVAMNGGSEYATVRTNVSPNFHIKVDIMEMFKTPNKMSIATNPTVMVSPLSALVSANYTDMFKLDHIHN